MGEFADAQIDRAIDAWDDQVDERDQWEQYAKNQYRPKYERTMKDKKMLTVGEVYEMEPGTADEAAWINPGFTAVISKMTRTKSRSGQPMFICTLKDPAGGDAEIGVTFFDKCSFEEGDVIELSGKGLRRTVYKDLQQVSISKDTEVHKIGRSAHVPVTPPPGSATPPNGAHSPGQHTGIFGGTVGMAMKESLELHFREYEPDMLQEALKDPGVWKDVYTTASDIIRVSLKLEKGELAPSVRDRNKTPEEKAVDEAKAKKEAEEKEFAAKIERERKEAEEKAKLAAASKTAAVDDDVPF